MTGTKPQRRADVLSEGDDAELMLYHPGLDELHVLNPTARLVWELCDGDHSPEEMVQQLRSTFQVSPDADLINDIERVLGDFRTKNLLTDI